MKAIWKYPINTRSHGNKFIIDLPYNARIFTVRMQGNTPCIWAMVDTKEETEERIFIIYGTGWEVKEENDDLVYIDTYLEQGGNCVWHLFEVI